MTERHGDDTMASGPCGRNPNRDPRGSKRQSRHAVGGACTAPPGTAGCVDRQADSQSGVRGSGPLGHRQAMSSRMMTPCDRGPELARQCLPVQLSTRPAPPLLPLPSSMGVRELGSMSMALTRRWQRGPRRPSAQLDDGPPSRSRRRWALRGQRQVRVEAGAGRHRASQPFCGAAARYGACNAWTRPRLRLAPRGGPMGVIGDGPSWADRWERR
jgi:hypothetical protein